MADDPLERAAKRLEEAAKQLSDLPALQKAQMQAQQAQAALGALGTPLGEQALGVRAVLESRLAAMEQQQQSMQLRAQAVHAESPLGQVQMRAQAQQKQQVSTDQLRLDTARMRAEALHYQTPQGQAQLRAEQESRRDNAQARAQLAAAKGEGPGMMETFGRVIRDAAGAVGMFTGALSQAEGILVGMGQKAAPAIAQTYLGSWDLLQSKIGALAIPALEQASRLLQYATRHIPDPESDKGRFISAGIERSIFGMFGDKIAAGEDVRHSLAGLPQSQLSTSEAYYERLQLSGLNYDELQTDILRQQLANQAHIIGLLQNLQPQPAPAVALR